MSYLSSDLRKAYKQLFVITHQTPEIRFSQGDLSLPWLPCIIEDESLHSCNYMTTTGSAEGITAILNITSSCGPW